MNGPPCGGLPPTSESTQSQTSQILQIAADLLEILKKNTEMAAEDVAGEAEADQIGSNGVKMRNLKGCHSSSAESN